MMTAKDIARTRLIEQWADNQVLLHRRICKDQGCSGRSKIWWITRHPATHPDIASKVAVDYVLSRQCCDILEERLVTGPQLGEVAFGWLPGEEELNRLRTREEKDQLLGRITFPPDNSGSTSVEVTSFGSPEREFLEVPKNKKGPARTRTEPHKESPEPVDWVDALTRRKD